MFQPANAPCRTSDAERAQNRPNSDRGGRFAFSLLNSLICCPSSRVCVSTTGADNRLTLIRRVGDAKKVTTTSTTQLPPYMTARA